MQHKKLTLEIVNERVKDLDGWHVEIEPKESLIKTIRFKNFSESFAFMTRVALACEKFDHHPEWSNVYDRVDVKLTTHDCAGVSEKDFVLARVIDQILSGN